MGHVVLIIELFVSLDREVMTSRNGCVYLPWTNLCVQVLHNRCDTLS